MQRLLESLDAVATQSTAALVDGVEATATVVAARLTGATVSANPVLDLDLVVRLPGHEPRPLTRLEVVTPPHLRDAWPGTTLRVKVDPADVSRLWIDWESKP